MSSSMTRQHFEAIAEAISTIEGDNLRRKVANKLCPVFLRFNSSFDKRKFKEACRVGDEELLIDSPPQVSALELFGDTRIDEPSNLAFGVSSGNVEWRSPHE